MGTEDWGIIVFGRRFYLFVFLVAAWLIYNTPYIHVPFKWFETYFHELSHGIAALLTVGSVDRLELNFDGSGTIWFSGSMLPVVVAFFGYAGAFVWGAVIYLAASNLKRFSSVCAAAMAVMIFITGIMWVRDIQSAMVALTILSVLVVFGWAKKIKLAQMGLQFIGTYVIVAAMYSPLVLFYVRGGHSDASRLREMTWIPEFVWIAVWILSGVFTLWITYRLEGRQDEKKTALRAGIQNPE